MGLQISGVQLNLDEGETGRLAGYAADIESATVAACYNKPAVLVESWIGGGEELGHRFVESRRWKADKTVHSIRKAVTREGRGQRHGLFLAYCRAHTHLSGGDHEYVVGTLHSSRSKQGSCSTMSLISTS